MNCNELVERVTDYLDSAMDPYDQERMDRHLTVCPGCIAHMGQVRVMLGALSGLSGLSSESGEPLSDGLETRLLTTYRQWAGSGVS